MPRRRVLQNVEHGKVRSYKLGCRCSLCTEANSKDSIKWRGKSTGRVKNWGNSGGLE
jgi:hypothetical protein